MEALTPTDPVAVEFGDGKSRHFRLSLGSLRRLKKVFGQSVLRNAQTLMDADEDSLGIIVYEALVEKDGLTVDTVADQIDTRRLAHVIEKFVEAYMAAVPEKNATSQTTTVQ